MSVTSDWEPMPLVTPSSSTRCRDTLHLVEFALATLKIALNGWNSTFLLPLINGIDAVYL
jgi:hypothetical protein